MKKTIKKTMIMLIAFSCISVFAGEKLADFSDIDTIIKNLSMEKSIQTVNLTRHLRDPNYSPWLNFYEQTAPAVSGVDAENRRFISFAWVNLDDQQIKIETIAECSCNDGTLISYGDKKIYDGMFDELKTKDGKILSLVKTSEGTLLETTYKEITKDVIHTKLPSLLQGKKVERCYDLSDCLKYLKGRLATQEELDKERPSIFSDIEEVVSNLNTSNIQRIEKPLPSIHYRSLSISEQVAPVVLGIDSTGSKYISFAWMNLANNKISIETIKEFNPSGFLISNNQGDFIIGGILDKQVKKYTINKYLLPLLQGQILKDCRTTIDDYCITTVHGRLVTQKELNAVKEPNAVRDNIDKQDL